MQGIGDVCCQAGGPGRFRAPSGADVTAEPPGDDHLIATAPALPAAVRAEALAGGAPGGDVRLFVVAADVNGFADPPDGLIYVLWAMDVAPGCSDHGFLGAEAACSGGAVAQRLAVDADALVG